MISVMRSVVTVLSVSYVTVGRCLSSMTLGSISVHGNVKQFSVWFGILSSD